jgi:hypothetical protein
MLAHLIRALRWLDRRITENSCLPHVHLTDEQQPLIVRHPFLGARIVTPLNNPPRKQRKPRRS